jgi:mono/diheme cytochrome c family protein
MKRMIVFVGLLGLGVARAGAHGSATAVTWNREMSRIVFDKCASCHRPGGTAFSMLTYPDVQPRANEIKDAVLSRRMPPWGAVKGFGSFRNDQSLSQEQIELVTRWVDGGIRRGNNPQMLPAVPTPTPALGTPAPSMTVLGTARLERALLLDGVVPEKVPPGGSMRVTAVLPNGRVEPLVWLDGYDERYRHPFLFRRPIMLPAGTTIRGVPSGAAIGLLAR